MSEATVPSAVAGVDVAALAAALVPAVADELERHAQRQAEVAKLAGRLAPARAQIAASPSDKIGHHEGSCVMGRGCGKGRQRFEVVTTDGKVVYNSTSRTTAESVAKRHDGRHGADEGSGQGVSR